MDYGRIKENERVELYAYGQDPYLINFTRRNLCRNCQFYFDFTIFLHSSPSHRQIDITKTPQKTVEWERCFCLRAFIKLIEWSLFEKRNLNMKFI